tara:strand:+ start:544 stop:945 length:402 start_codon:yes stop_codon:yes gene_type:complete
MLLVFIVSALSIMLFYSFLITISVHKTLDKENAGKLLRVLFPSYFLVTAILSLLALAYSLLADKIIDTILLSLVFIGSVISRQYLVPKINKERDLQISGKTDSNNSFVKLHGFSVLINFAQVMILIILLIKNL